MRQSQAIKVTNLDSKVQTDKETRKHSDMLPTSIRTRLRIIKLQQDEHTDKPVRKLAQRTIRKRIFEICCVLELLQQPKYRYLSNLLRSKKLAILHSPITAMSFRRARCFRIPSLSLMTTCMKCNKQDARVLCNGTSTASISVRRTHRSILLIRDNANLLILFKQDDTNLCTIMCTIMWIPTRFTRISVIYVVNVGSKSMDV